MNATPRPWRFAVTSDGWDGITTHLVADTQEWRECEYSCEWPSESDSHKGTPGKPGHFHRDQQVVLSGWGFDACGIDVGDADAAFIVEAVNAHDRLQAEHEKAQVLYRQVEAWNQDGQPKGVACPDGYLLINKDRAADILVASHRYAQAVKEVRGDD